MDYTEEQFAQLSSEELEEYFSSYSEVVTFTPQG